MSYTGICDFTRSLTEYHQRKHKIRLTVSLVIADSHFDLLSGVSMIVDNIINIPTVVFKGTSG